MLQTGQHPAVLKDAVTSKPTQPAPACNPPPHRCQSLTLPPPVYSHYPHPHPPLHFAYLSAPGGTTIAGLLSLEDSGVRGALARCIQVTAEKAAALGAPAKK